MAKLTPARIRHKTIINLSVIAHYGRWAALWAKGSWLYSYQSLFANLQLLVDVYFPQTVIQCYGYTRYAGEVLYVWLGKLIECKQDQ